MPNHAFTASPIWNNGPVPGNFYNFPQNQAKSSAEDDYGYQRMA
jgi:hypothetical protein